MIGAQRPHFTGFLSVYKGKSFFWNGQIYRKVNSKHLNLQSTFVMFTNSNTLDADWWIYIYKSVSACFDEMEEKLRLYALMIWLSVHYRCARDDIYIKMVGEESGMGI